MSVVYVYIRVSVRTHTYMYLNFFPLSFGHRSVSYSRPVRDENDILPSVRWIFVCRESVVGPLVSLRYRCSDPVGDRPSQYSHSGRGHVSVSPVQSRTPEIDKSFFAVQVSHSTFRPGTPWLPGKSGGRKISTLRTGADAAEGSAPMRFVGAFVEPRRGRTGIGGRGITCRDTTGAPCRSIN